MAGSRSPLYSSPDYAQPGTLPIVLWGAAAIAHALGSWDRSKKFGDATHFVVVAGNSYIHKDVEKDVRTQAER